MLSHRLSWQNELKPQMGWPAPYWNHQGICVGILYF